MKRKNNKTFGLVLCFLFFIPSLFYSQTLKDAIYSPIPESGAPSEGKEVAPVFILQGAVKLQGQPEAGVSLTLTKDGKAISKIITPKNGLYYFQLKRSGIDSQSEYLLTITKPNVASGKLKINTYTPKEQLTPIPYIFNLDINIAPLSSSGAVERRDFGKIKWIAEKSAFNFDKNYVPINEKEIIADSLRQIAVAKENAELKRQADSIATVMAIAIEEEERKERVIKKAAKEKAVKIAAEKAAAKGIAKQTNSNTAAKVPKTNEVVTNAKTKSQGANELSKTGALASKGKIKSQQQQNNTGPVDLYKNNTDEKGGQKTNELNPMPGQKERPGNISDAIQKISSNQRILIIADSLAAAGASPKDLFFLTGVPMEQFKKNLSAGSVNDKNTDVYDAKEVFSANSERNRLLALKQRYERKKAENFAKKQETNNTLTSLMDVVEEYDKNKKK